MARAFLREGRRLFLRGLHLLGSRTVVLLGLALAIVTGTAAARNLWFVFSGTTAEGVVVRQIEELEVDPQSELPGPLSQAEPGVRTVAAARVYRAVVEYQAGGARHQVVAGARARVHLYPLGTKTEVIFPRGRPERARLAAELPDVWLQAGFLLVATVVGAGSGYTWWTLAVRGAARRRRGAALSRQAGR